MALPRRRVAPHARVRLYLDHNVPAVIATALRRRGADVVTAMEDGLDTAVDEQLLERATELGCVLVSLDRDFRRLAAKYQRNGTRFAGVATLRGDPIDIGRAVADLEVVAMVGEEGELDGVLLYIPFV